MQNLQKGYLVPVLSVIIALLVISGGIYVYQNKPSKSSSAGAASNLPKTYKNTDYNISYSEDLWVPATDVEMYLLNKETNFEQLLILVKKSPQNGKQCTDTNSGRTVSCNYQLESIKFAIINKTLNEVKASIPSYRLTEYDAHAGYNSTCAPLNQTKYVTKIPSVCAFSGFEWDEHAEYFYPVGNKTLVVNWNYYDADKNVYTVSERNFLEVMGTLKIGR
jgi:hypothetical protein